MRRNRNRTKVAANGKVYVSICVQVQNWLKVVAIAIIETRISNYLVRTV